MPAQVSFREPQADKWGVEYSSNGTVVKHLVLELKGGLDHRLSWESSASAASNGSKKSDRMQVKDKKMDQKMVKMMKKKQKAAEAEAEKKRMAKVHVKQLKASGDQTQVQVKQTKPSVDKTEQKLCEDMDKMMARRQQEMEAELKRKQTPYHNKNSALCSLAEAPYKCCPISRNGWDCPLHPRDPPMEYWRQHLKDTKEALRRAYRVELFLLSKRYEYGISALHKERRQQLNLTNLPSSQDFPETTLTSPKDKSRVLGKLCLFHKLKFDGQRRGFPGSGVPAACWVCRYDNLYKEYVCNAHAAYEAYCRTYADALDKAHGLMGYMFFKYSPLVLNPGVEYSRYSTGIRRVLRITDWAQNKKGQPGNLCRMSRESAFRAKERKASVWERMEGGQDYVAVDPKDTMAFKTGLATVKEE